MITCQIIVEEINGAVAIQMKPDNREGTKKERAVAIVLDYGIRSTMLFIQKFNSGSGPMVEGEGIGPMVEEFLERERERFHR
jgi:hypothetical protein